MYTFPLIRGVNHAKKALAVLFECLFCYDCVAIKVEILRISSG